MTTNTDTSDVYPTEPEMKLFSWKPAPTKLEQALDAANDDPTFREFVNMLSSLEELFVHVDGRDEDWWPTEVRSSAWIIRGSAIV